MVKGIMSESVSKGEREKGALCIAKPPKRIGEACQRTEYRLDPFNTKTSDEGISFSWLPSIREGTQLVIVGGDNRGLGTGGKAPFTIAHSDDSSCVTADSAGITPGAVAGAVKST
jgi:hypothetical protein